MKTRKRQLSGETRSEKKVDVDLSEKELRAVAGGRDPASGLPTGQRIHTPLTITGE